MEDAQKMELDLLIKTCIIDISTWLFLTIPRCQEIFEFLENIQHLKNLKQILDSYRIFQRGNAADSKKSALNL